MKRNSNKESPLNLYSDKEIYHKYLPFYEKFLKDIDKYQSFDIFEIGVFNGKSIENWHKKFPNSNIIGADIVKEKDNWIKSEKIKYIQFDQSKASILKKELEKIKNPKIIIDDGSHHPIHQMIFLHLSTSEILKRKNDEKKFIILEDIHTSLKRIIESRNFFHKIYNKLKDKIRLIFNKINYDNEYWDYAKSLDLTTTLGLLLTSKKIIDGSLQKEKFIEALHEKKIKKGGPDFKIVLETLENLLKAKKISVYKRSELPDLCWKCGEDLFDPLTLKCSKCGSDPYSLCDSMTVVIEF